MTEKLTDGAAAKVEAAPKPEATPTPEKTYTEAEVQARVSAATSTTQKALTAADLKAGLFEKRATAAEAAQVTSDKSLAASQREVAVLKKSETMVDSTVEWAQYQAAEEAKLEQAKADVGRLQLNAEATRLHNETGADEAILLTARSGAEMMQIAIDHLKANPPTTPAAVDPAAPTPPAADAAPPAADPATPPAAPTSQPDRGGAGNAGATPSDKHGIDAIAEGISTDPRFKEFLAQFPSE